MTTAATSLLGLALPVTGELSGTWGDTVNNQITSLLDTAIAGTTTLSTDADVTLTTTTLAANQARQSHIAVRRQSRGSSDSRVQQRRDLVVYRVAPSAGKFARDR